jgi:hypothetical protein
VLDISSGAEPYIHVMRPQQMIWMGGGSLKLIFNVGFKNNT